MKQRITALLAALGALACGDGERMASDLPDTSSAAEGFDAIADGEAVSPETSNLEATISSPETGMETWDPPALSCEYQEWLGPESPWRYFHCDGDVGAFECSCDGEPATSAATDCEAAMIDACGVARTEREWCNYPGAEVCWPSGDNDWSCRCETSGELHSVVGGDCYNAVFTACAEPCAGAAGACEPNDDWTYTCDCEHYPQTRTIAGDLQCWGALNRCQPIGPRCSNFAGFCDQNTTGYRCGCVDGTTRDYTFAEAGYDVCETLVVELCGDPVVPDLGCEGERERDGVSMRGSCTQTSYYPEPEDDGGFTCRCDRSSASSTSTNVGSAAGVSCEAALEAFCFW